MPDVVALSDSFVPSLPKGWNATVRIKLADGTTDATVYKDANGDATGANPLPLAAAEFGRNYDGNGGWQCYLVPGDYVVSVTPHGGSEHHASVTVTSAAAVVARGLYEVYGTPTAAAPVPTWNPDTGRLEFAAGGGGGGASAPLTIYLESNSGADNNVSVSWDTVYDARGNTLDDIPAEMGLTRVQEAHPQDRIIVTDASWLGRVELMCNMVEDDTAWVDVLLKLSGDYTGGPRLDLPVSAATTGLHYEFCLSAWGDLVQDDYIRVAAALVNATSTDPDYAPWSYGVLKLTRFNVPS